MNARVQKEKTYVIVTAAYNEETLIGRTIAAVTSQIVRPRRWVIVSDASTDRTDEIVREYARRHRFMHLVRVREKHARNFAAKVHAIRAGLAALNGMQYDFIGNLDADVSFAPSYYGELLKKFTQDPELGLAGGFVLEERRGQFRNRRMNSRRSVAGAVQLFRRECFEAIGGYLPLRGGEDWHAEIASRMKGWRVQAFPELEVFHHRPTGSAEPLLRQWFFQGRVAYSQGSWPFFELLKCIGRFPEKPVIVGGLTRMAGFLWSSCTGQQREVSQEFIDFLRREQVERLHELKLWLPPRTTKRELDN